MSISLQTARSQFTLSSKPETLTIPWYFLAAGDLKVIRTRSGVDTDATLNTHYTVAGAGNEAGGSVTILNHAFWTVGDTVTVYRDAQLVQPADLVANGQFPSATMETALDRHTMQIQQIKLMAERGLRLPMTEAALISPMAKTSRASKVISFDASGTLEFIDRANQIDAAASAAAAAAAAARFGVESIAALKALSVSGLTSALVEVKGYYAAGDGGGGLFTYNSASAAAENAGTIFAPSVGSGRWLRIYSGPVNVRWFGAKGDAVNDDAAAIQAAITLAQNLPNGAVYVPPCEAGDYYRVESTLTVGAQVQILGDSPLLALIIGIGIAAGKYVLDYDIPAGTSYFFRLENICLRSLDGVPNGLRVKNASYFTAENVYLYGFDNGLVIQGTTCFSNRFVNLVCYNSGSRGVFFDGFNGGGHYTFDHCTFDGGTGFYVGDTSEIAGGLALLSCNFEQCGVNCLYFGGSVSGCSIVSPRTEGNAGGVDFQINPALGEEVSGLVISGGMFSADSANCVAIQLGGAGGIVRGFTITGNRAINSSLTHFVLLNGDGESGVIAGNRFDQPATLPASAQRAGVVVFANENGGGKCAEWWGAAQWGVIEYALAFADASGAGLALVNSTGYATKIGRTVFWQGIVVYPATADGSAAAVSGLPSNPLVAGNTEGRAGAHVDRSDAGIDLAILQGVPDTNKFSFYNRQTGAAVTNAALSGKVIYLSGHYTIA